MSLLEPLHARLTHEELRTATLIGVVAIPFILLENLLVGADPGSAPISGVSLVLACVATGYLYADRSTEARWACEQTVALGIVPMGIWWATEYVGALQAGWTNALVATVLTVLAVSGWAVGVWVFGHLGAFLGKWLHRGVRRVRPVSVGA